MRYIQKKISGLPLALLCFEDATVMIVPTQQFKAIIDLSEDNKSVAAVFDRKGFRIGSIDYIYQFQYKYKADEVLLGWLKRNFIW